MITLRHNYQKVMEMLLATKKYNSITTKLIQYLSQPYITVFGYYALLENYGILNQISIKKNLITLLLDLTTELQKTNFLSSDNIKDLQTLKTLFVLNDEDFECYTKERVLEILAIQGTRVESQFAKTSVEVEYSYTELKLLFGVTEDTHQGSIYAYAHSQATLASSCTPA